MSINNKSNLKKSHSQVRNSSFAQKGQKSILQILEAKLSIICDLCNHQVIEPKICPSCNQIFCEQCLIKYYDEYKNCPMCHEKYLFGEFLDCQCNTFLDFFRRQLKQLNLDKKQQKSKLIFFETKNFHPQKQSDEKCQEHQMAMKYFCEDCSRPICSDCGMMSPMHKSHKFSRLDDIYVRIKQKLNKELNKLINKIFQSQQHSFKIKKKLQKLQVQHMHIKKYTEEYYILLVQKFQQEIATKTVCLKQIQQKNAKQIEFYESCRDSICQEIQKKSKNQLINQVDKLITSFTMVTCDPPEPIKIQECFQTIKQLLPQYNNFQYCLHSFSLSNGGIVYSDSYILNGVEWRLKIYPKGNGVVKGKYLSVFVQMTKAQTNQKKYQYKIELLNKDLTAQNIRRQYCSAFDIGQCWGYNQFIQLQQLQNGFLTQDKLNFVMGIRNPDYRTLSQDQANYISQLQNQIKFKQLQRQNHIEETNIIDDLQSKSYSSKNNTSVSNQTKFLKFLENSTSYQERINERKQKQREKEFEKGQKDQQYLTLELLNQLNEDFREEKQQRPNSNFQSSNYQSQYFCGQNPIQNNFILKDDQIGRKTEIMEFKENQKKIQKKELKGIIKNMKSIGMPNESGKHLETQKLENKKYQSHNRMNQRKQSEQINRYQPKLKSQNKQQIREQKRQFKQKQQKNTQKNKDKKETPDQKYQFYFNSKKNLNQNNTKQTKKYQSNTQKQKIAERFSQPQQGKCLIKQPNKKKLSDLKIKQKTSDEKPKSQLYQQAKTIDKTQEKKYIRSKQYSKKSPPKFKAWMEQQENRQKQISNILEQSKKLEGIGSQKGNISSNSSGIRQNTSGSAFLKSPVKNNYLKNEKERQNNTKKQEKQ